MQQMRKGAFSKTPMNNLTAKDFYYDLPPELIAQTPLEKRDESRLLCYDLIKDKITHNRFYDIKNFLKKGDVLVINNTRVIPARLIGEATTGGKMEFLLLKRLDKDNWEALVKPGRRAKLGAVFQFSDNLKAEITGDTSFGGRTVKFIYDGVFEDVLNKTGIMPLPPYIKKKLDDKERYQTVYSKVEGSAAAPTAGLHFTNELLEEIKKMGIEICEVILHVGLGTFRPVKVNNIAEHKMHSEYYELDAKTAETINKAKTENRRIIAVGTTSVRVLESCAEISGKVKESIGNTDIFIYPPYKFKCINALITNFHLPESTLLMLVSAFANREKILEIYKTAIENQYRFFSFGDAMFLY